MQAEVVDSGRKLPTISQRMAIAFITVYAIRQKHVVSDYDILSALSDDK